MNHTVRAFDADLADLDRCIVELGDAAEALLSDAEATLLQGGAADAAVRFATEKTRALAESCADRAIALIVKRQPVANDLRRIVAALRIADDYERIADLSRAIVEHGRLGAALDEAPSLKKVSTRLAHLALDQMRTLRGAERDGDEELCRLVWRRDRMVDAAYADAFREAVHMLSLTPQMSFVVVDVLFCAKNLERISDHVRTIADMIHFARTGEHLGLGRDHLHAEAEASAA